MQPQVKNIGNIVRLLYIHHKKTKVKINHATNAKIIPEFIPENIDISPG